MKKMKAILSALLAGIMSVAMFGLVACNVNEPEKETFPNETQGAFTCAADANHTQVIKFKAGGEFYAHGLMQQKGYHGKYEIVDEEIAYVDFGADGNFDPKADSDEVLKSTKAIKFLNEDGTTSTDITRRSPTEVEEALSAANAGKEENLLAYTADGRIHAVNIDGYFRTLTHSKDNAFSEENEIANLLYTFMVKDIPDWADGYTQQDLTFKLYDRKFEDLATGENRQTGVVSAANNVYTLTYDEGSATLTVAEDGKSATLVKGGKTINLVEYAQAIPIAATISGNMGPTTTLTMTMYEDGSLVLVSGSKEFNGTYEVADGTLTVNFAAGSPFTVSSASYADNTVSVVIVAPTGVPDPATMEVTLTGTATGTLYGVKAGPTVMKALDTSVEIASGITRPFEMKLLSDSTFSIASGENEIADGYWKLVMNGQVPALTFSKISNGAVTGAFGEGGTYKITWTGTISPVGEKTAEFSMPSSDFAALQGAKVAEKHVVEGAEWNTRATKIVFYADGTLEVNVGGTAIATAEWAFAMNGATPSVTISNCSNGELSAGWGENSTYAFTWVGKVSPQMPNDSTLVFSMPATELANLR